MSLDRKTQSGDESSGQPSHSSLSQRSHLQQSLALLIWLAAISLSSLGCVSHSERLGSLRSHFYAGQLDEAEVKLAELAEENPEDRDVLLLDQAMIDLANGDPAAAEATLRQVRDDFGYLQQSSAAEEALSFLTDETEKAYAGEPYERVLIRVFLALSSLVHDGHDADAYALQIEQEQLEILRQHEDAKPDEEPQLHLAIGPYLRGIMAEATHSRYDDALRSFNTVAAWQPTFNAAQHDIQRVQYGHHSEKGNGVVYLFTLVGRGPCKEVVNEQPTTNALLIADRILSATGKHSLPPTIAPIKVPRVVRAPNRIDRVSVAVNGEPVGDTETITDVTALALAESEADHDRIVARAVARRVVKKAVVYTAKETTQVAQNSFVNFAMDAAGVLWEATETADTRCWGVLPDTIQVLRIELPAGTHEIALTPASGTGPKGGSERVSVRVEDGRNTYVLANFPGDQLVGRVLTSTR